MIFRCCCHAIICADVATPLRYCQLQRCHYALRRRAAADTQAAHTRLWRRAETTAAAVSYASDAQCARGDVLRAAQCKTISDPLCARLRRLFDDALNARPPDCHVRCLSAPCVAPMLMSCRRSRTMINHHQHGRLLAGCLRHTAIFRHKDRPSPVVRYVHQASHPRATVEAAARHGFPRAGNGCG